MAARNKPLTLVCHPSPAERSAATTSLSSRKVTWVLFWPRGRPRPRVTASMMCGMASRAGRAVRNSAAVSGESSARDSLVLAGRDRFIGPRFSAVGAAKADQSHAVHPVGKDHRVQAAAQPSNCGLTSLAVGSTGPINDHRRRPVEIQGAFEGYAVLGQVARSLGRVPGEHGLNVGTKIDENKPFSDFLM